MATSTDQSLPPTEALREKLMTKFDHKVKRSRLVAVEKAITTMFPLEVLLEWTRDSRWRVRESVATVLGRYAIANAAQEATLAETLQGMLQDEHWRVTAAAAGALCARMSETWLPQLIAQLEQTSCVYNDLTIALQQAVVGIAVQSKSLPTLLYALKRMRYRASEQRQQCLHKILEIWRTNPSQFDRVLESTEISDSAREILARYTPAPFPEWLNTTEDQCLVPQLHRLVIVGVLTNSEVAELLHLRIVQDGFDLVHFYEILPFSREITSYEFKRLNQELEPYTEEITSLLQSWMPQLGHLQKDAIQWLGIQGARATSALPLLFQMTNEGDADTQHYARNAIFCILQPNHDGSRASNEHPSSQTELIGSLRTLLHLPWDRTTWRLLKALLDSCQDHEDIEIAIDYIDMHIPAEARQQTAQNKSWLKTLLDPEPTPFLRLLRHIDLSLLLQEHPELSARQIIGHKYLQRTTHLDIQNTLIDSAFIDALEGIQAPQTITHLYLSNTQLNTQLAVRFLQTLGLPQLTHLYISNNALDAQHMAELASCSALAHVTHINLKHSLTPEAAILLAQSPYLRSLSKINLSHNKLTDEAIYPWLANAILPAGVQIDARHNSIKEQTELMLLAEKAEITLFL